MQAVDAWHVPLTQVVFAGHAVFDGPQCIGSVCGSTQLPPTSTSPGRHLHEPDEQN